MDKRVEKTHLAIQNALLELLKHHRFNDITFTQLCRTANINRNTFYVHYNGIYDVLFDIEEQLFEKIQPYVGRYRTWESAEEISSIIERKGPAV